MEEAAERSASEESRRRKALSEARKQLKAAHLQARRQELQRLLTGCPTLYPITYTRCPETEQ